MGNVCELSLPNKKDKQSFCKGNEAKDSGLRELKQIYKFDQTKVVGKGHFGKVFLASNRKNAEHKVAIKVLNTSEDKMREIQNEINVLKELDHPNIVKFYETYIEDNKMYLVMEYIAGGELFKMILKRKDNCLTEGETKHHILRLIEALNHMHLQDIAHRDIKPENILLDENGEIKLIDFGLSTRV